MYFSSTGEFVLAVFIFFPKDTVKKSLMVVGTLVEEVDSAVALYAWNLIVNYLKKKKKSSNRKPFTQSDQKDGTIIMPQGSASSNLNQVIDPYTKSLNFYAIFLQF